MSEEEFEEEALKRGFHRRERRREEGEVESSKKTSCFDSCFGRGGVSRKDARRSSLETVSEEDHGSEFEFVPRTQGQNMEPPIRSVSSTPPGMSAPTTTHATPEQTPMATPMETPIETPIPTPIETPTETPRAISIYSNRNIYYTLDGSGGVRQDARGKRVKNRMHELVTIYFPDDIFTDWRRQPEGSKQQVLEHLHAQYPNPDGMRFNEIVMKRRMGHVLKTRRAAARIAAAAGDYKPSFLSDNDWRTVTAEHRTFPARWDQQREANRVQRETTGISRLGSGGRATFHATFEDIVGRAPTQSEYEEGRNKGPKALYERLRSEGVPLKMPTKEKASYNYSNLAYASGPNGELESDGDESYVPSDDPESEEEDLESEGEDVDIWLREVDNPQTSTRRGSHRN